MKKKRSVFDDIDKNSYAYQKYMKRYDENAPENIQARKEQKKQQFKKWWSDNWLAVISVIIALAALIIAVGSFHFTRLSYEAMVGQDQIAQVEPNG